MNFIFAIIFSVAAVCPFDKDCALDDSLSVSADAVAVQVSDERPDQISEDERIPDEIAQTIIIQNDWDTDKDAMRLSSATLLHHSNPFQREHLSLVVRRPMPIFIPPDIL